MEWRNQCAVFYPSIFLFVAHRKLGVLLGNETMQPQENTGLLGYCRIY